MGNIDPDPTATELLCGGDSCPTAAEWVEHDVTRVVLARDNPFEKCFGFLCRVAETFSRRLINAIDIRPDVAHGYDSRLGIERLAGLAAGEAAA